MITWIQCEFKVDSKEAHLDTRLCLSTCSPYTISLSCVTICVLSLQSIHPAGFPDPSQWQNAVTGFKVEQEGSGREAQWRAGPS